MASERPFLSAMETVAPRADTANREGSSQNAYRPQAGRRPQPAHRADVSQTLVAGAQMIE